jgi:hypothetical protein
MSASETEKFHHTGDGRFRRRLGRGGRIVIDRLVSDNLLKIYSTSPEYRRVPIIRRTILNRAREMSSGDGIQVGASSFRLLEKKCLDYDLNKFNEVAS